jgi:hypothetical protein
MLSVEERLCSFREMAESLDLATRQAHERGHFYLAGKLMTESLELLKQWSECLKEASDEKLAIREAKERRAAANQRGKK